MNPSTLNTNILVVSSLRMDSGLKLARTESGAKPDAGEQTIGSVRPNSSGGPGGLL